MKERKTFGEAIENAVEDGTIWIDSRGMPRVTSRDQLDIIARIDRASTLDEAIKIALGR